MQPTEVQTNVGIELHDSDVVAIRQDLTNFFIDLSVYVHRTHGVPGVDPGSVWNQTATISLFNGQLLSIAIDSLDPDYDIYDGSVTTGGRILKNVVPCPLDSVTEALLDLSFRSGGQIRIKADRLTIAFTGESRYLYDFEGHRK
jgi:hypothetical protein